MKIFYCGKCKINPKELLVMAIYALDVVMKKLNTLRPIP
jgi:hypothetical protein